SAAARHDMPGSSANHHHSQIEDPAIMAGFRLPLLDMHAMAAESIEKCRNLLPISIDTNLSGVIESQFAVLMRHLHRSRRLMPGSAIGLIGYHSGGAGTVG